MRNNELSSEAAPSPHRAEGPNTRGRRAATGIEGLDNVLGGGLPVDRLYLIQGYPGTGKTTLALQFLRHGQSQGEPGLYITLAESAEELRATAASHGWGPDGVEIHEHLPVAQITSETQHTLFHPDEVDLSETMTALLQVIERVQPRRLVLDSLSELQLLAGNPLRYRREVLALKDYFAHRNCTVLLLEGLTPEYGAERRRMRVTKRRGLRFRGGWHDYAIETGGLRIFPRLVAAEHSDRAEAGQVASGLPPLDAMFGGGLDRGTTTLLMGPSGTGKSSVATRFAVAAAERGERAALYVFDERPATLFARAEGLGMDLRGHAAAGRIDVQPIDAAELTPGEFAHRVRRGVEEEGVRLVVIDSLAGYLYAMPGAQALILHLHELLTYLGQRGVTTLMIITQHGMLGTAIAGDVDVSYLADNVLLFRYYEHAGEVRKALSVFKRRSGSHEYAIRQLTLGGAAGIGVGEPLSEFRGVLTGVPVYEKPLRPVRESSKSEGLSDALCRLFQFRRTHFDPGSNRARCRAGRGGSDGGRFENGSLRGCGGSVPRNGIGRGGGADCQGGAHPAGPGTPVRDADAAASLVRPAAHCPDHRRHGDRGKEAAACGAGCPGKHDPAGTSLARGDAGSCRAGGPGRAPASVTKCGITWKSDSGWSSRFKPNMPSSACFCATSSSASPAGACTCATPARICRPHCLFLAIPFFFLPPGA